MLAFWGCSNPDFTGSELRSPVVWGRAVDILNYLNISWGIVFNKLNTY